MRCELEDLMGIGSKVNENDASVDQFVLIDG